MIYVTGMELLMVMVKEVVSKGKLCAWYSVRTRSVSCPKATVEAQFSTSEAFHRVSPRSTYRLSESLLICVKLAPNPDIGRPHELIQQHGVEQVEECLSFVDLSRAC